MLLWHKSISQATKYTQMSHRWLATMPRLIWSDKLKALVGHLLSTYAAHITVSSQNAYGRAWLLTIHLAISMRE